jgi:hypothetical protein
MNLFNKPLVKFNNPQPDSPGLQSVQEVLSLMQFKNKIDNFEVV